MEGNVQGLFEFNLLVDTSNVVSNRRGALLTHCPMTTYVKGSEEAVADEPAHHSRTAPPIGMRLKRGEAKALFRVGYGP